MSDARKPKLREAEEDAAFPKLDIASPPQDAPDEPLNPEQIYLRRKAEVTRQDNEEFSEYLQQKHARDQQQQQQQQQQVQVAEPPAAQAAKVQSPQPLDLGGRHRGRRRSGHARLSDAHRPEHSAAGPSARRRHLHRAAAPSIDRELVNPQADMGGRRFGDWVLLMPTKLGGGTYAVNLNTGRTLAWISYWNYGDYNPISHHLCAFPSADPAKGFEWINSTQGGKNSLIYGIPTNIETPAEGFNIYRVRYDGSQMELMENVAETTGLGLGVHVTIDPQTAERYFVTDGQKDIAACFDRRTSRVIAAIKYDWVPNVRNLADAWQKGGVLKISRSIPIPRPANMTIAAPRARRSNGKWCRWANCSSKRAHPRR